MLQIQFSFPQLQNQLMIKDLNISIYQLVKKTKTTVRFHYKFTRKVSF